MAYIPIGRLEDIAPLGARRYRRADGVEIAVFRTAADTVFALRDKCPHKGGPLSQGIVFGESVACPLHNWCIGLADGTAAAPDEGVVERFAVKLQDGQVLLDPDSGIVEKRSCSPVAVVAAP
ncbi:MAG TPA: nitrite reductase small subunit NirD [Usitatibacteraceae bacterium]|nr:nitrite reductase small subunit NirD [Usitatibacteraceae bacterium]